MKAIHNMDEGSEKKPNTVFNTSNIQNESNSQPLASLLRTLQNCVQYVKYTK